MSNDDLPETTSKPCDSTESTEAPKPPPLPWPQFVEKATENEVRERFSDELNSLLATHIEHLKNYRLLAILEPQEDIDSFELDQIYTAISAWNSRDRDILLILLSRGGIIEPAYQISKLCKAYSKDRFIVAVPRQAKSAATLIALGADEIHIGPLGQLGPIDPQLAKGLPALGVTQALQTIASL
jgi:ClpP class serine protease